MYKYDLGLKIEQGRSETDFDLEEFIINHKISGESAEILKKYNYLQEALKQITEELDQYQINHVIGVSEKSLLVAQKLNLSDEETDLLVQASFLHDIGKAEDEDIANLVNSSQKIFVNADGAEKREKLEEHVRVSIEWCKKRDVPKEVQEIIGHHHEREQSDENNYPRKKNEAAGNDRRKEPGEVIKNLQRIFYLIDKYDSWRQKRSYKEALSPEECKEELRKNGIDTKEDRKIIGILVSGE